MTVRRIHGIVATALIAAAVLLPVPVLSQERERDRDVSITVYNNDLGLVREIRPLRLDRGQSEVRITDVAARIDPTSVHFLSLADPEGTSVLEQNYQFDLVSGERILERYIDQKITAVMKDGKEIGGTLLSNDGASLVLRGDGGGIQIVSRAEVREIRFPELPGGLITRPTLLWRLDASKGGDQRIELSYLTGGLSWHAEYVAVANAKNTNLSLAGWVSLENTSGASYVDARLKLIAGDVHRVQPRQPPQPMMDEMRAMSKAVPFEERSFFEYHLYELQRRTTLADREVKQVSLFPSAQVPVRKVYSYDGQNDEKKVRVTLEFENRESQGLGMPLPAGTVRVFQEDERGGQEFVGEDRIDHTPKDERVRVYVGDAFDVVGERAVMDARRPSDREQEQDVRIKIRNHKEERIEVVIIEHQYGDWKVLRSSHETRQKDAVTLEIPVAVEKDGEAMVTYTVRTRY